MSSKEAAVVLVPSMKVPPKRKGNFGSGYAVCLAFTALNESPSEKEGKSLFKQEPALFLRALNESPSEKEGKSSWSRFGSIMIVNPQ